MFSRLPNLRLRNPSQERESTRQYRPLLPENGYLFFILHIASEIHKIQARSPSLEIVEPSYPTPRPATHQYVESPPARVGYYYNLKTVRRPESQASCLPTQPLASSPAHGSAVSAKRRKVGVDIEVENGGDSNSGQPSKTTPLVNDTPNISMNVPPQARTPAAVSLSADSSRSEATPHRKGKENAGSIRVTAARPDPPSSSTSSVLTVSDNRQSTTTGSHSALPPSNLAQIPVVNVPSPPPTTRSAPATVPKAAPIAPPLEKVSPPSTNSVNSNIRDAVVTTERPSLPTSAADLHLKTDPLTCESTSAALSLSQNASQVQDKGGKANGSSSTAPASTKTRQISLMKQRSGHQSPTSWNQKLLDLSRKHGLEKEVVNFLRSRKKGESLLPDTPSTPPVLSSVVQKYLPSDEVRRRLIFPLPLQTEFPRIFLSTVYGGGTNPQFLQIFRKDKDPKGAIERRAVFLQPGSNPSVPSAAGQPGLVFAWRHKILENAPWSVFRKGLSGSGEVYLGDYRCEMVGKMSPMEFRSLAPSIKSGCAKELLLVEKYDRYVSMRARIALRKHGCIPLADKSKADVLFDEEVDAIKANNGRPLDAGDIISALERGDEAINLVRMICIAYDHAFAEEMERKFAEYKASFTSASTAEPSPSRGKTIAARAPASAVPKPKIAPPPLRRNRSPETDESSEFELEVATPIVPSDRKLRPRASRVIVIDN
ncbi:hypothetical protein M413DRAFT_282123 [Hebeloma cylindrosporum]|uniref:DUF6697 domain-containing protein n=1 Tax=Hebeloma cylindrosporum TaxID=76867 RepID=A0A0C3BXX7_HEBCY|nr:hypothetical protein M413DRAFT_282123 [Hebeloma cylindrosporum h7]